MPLQLLSRTTTDTIRSRSPSPLTTPASKPQIPTICLTTATPCDSDAVDDAARVAPWTTSDASSVPIAPKLLKNGETSRKRLVPKKSKLGLLGSSSSSASKVREQDFSDVVRRVGGESCMNGTNEFEIYVDPANDPDIGEILMVKKKKSRLALDGMQWGTLGEVTNVPNVTKSKEKGTKKESLAKVKAEENQKWWSIGRGRKDSKEKEKDKDKVKAKDLPKSPEPSDKPADGRARYNSLDSGILLSNSAHSERPKARLERLRAPTPPPATDVPPAAAGAGTGKDSVAIRAMRSVRSLARIGSWAQLKSMPNPDTVAVTTVPVKDKESDGKKKKKKKDREKEKDKSKETIRYSGSSFEAGALTASPAASKYESKSLGKKKASILGLGLPSTMRLPSSRSGSTASSVVTANAANHRLSVDSANLLGGILARERSGSTMSTVSSLRPMSTKSRESSGSSGATSVKWDEAGLKTVKELRRKDKERRSEEKEKEKEKEKQSKEKKKSKKSKSGKSEKESARKSLDSRKRTPLSAIFPGTASARKEDEVECSLATPIDAATVGEHAAGSPTETPLRRVRSRPVSDQPLGPSRPKPLYEGDDDNVAMSLLDAATNDLAQLINRLDLEATPGSVEMTPMGEHPPFLLAPRANSPPNDRLPVESPVKRLRCKNPSVTSLRPYAHSYSKSAGAQLGQNIAPWSTLNANISPSKSPPSTIRGSAQNTATVRSHRRTLTPAPAAEPSPVFKALRPATARLPICKAVVDAPPGVSPFVTSASHRSPSSLTFGSGHSKSESRGSFSISPVFKKAQSLVRKKSSLGSTASLGNGSLPILPEVRRNLGLAGTMGGSVGSIAEQDYDGSDPDSDIPDELQVILSNSDQEDTMTFDPNRARLPLPSPGRPPEVPLPVFDSPRLSLARTALIDDDPADVEVTSALSEDDTKRSFDFTGELRKLNESGVSDRRSFIEQLENAFRTPAKMDLRYDFEDLPPVPKLNTLQDELSRVGEHSFSLSIEDESRELMSSDFPMDVDPQPTLLPRSNSFATTASDEEFLNILAPNIVLDPAFIASRPSNGKLNRDFKFGGTHTLPVKKDSSPLTLSDIIPPPEVARSLSMASLAGDDNSFMQSILAHAIVVDSPPEVARRRIDSDASSRLEVPGGVRHSNASVLSFAGFDSFAEVRRGFEFHDHRPGFYPPAVTTSGKPHRKHDSIYSIASISSYGNVIHGGSADPFDYGVSLPSVRERPSSDNFSFTMSTTVDDTFSFLRRPPIRRRVDSDASSCYFRASMVHPYNRGHRRHGSGVSVGPPISIYNRNRNSTHHRRGDSIASINSLAPSYANCRRFSWSRRRSDYSVDSELSDFTGTNLGRPGLGDKMLDSALEHPTPLASISASPPPSLAGSLRRKRTESEEYDRRLSYDSIMDGQFESQKTDSLFEKTGHRNSVCSSDTSFFEPQSDDVAAKLPRYRPISSLSIPSVHSSPKEDDTMISMLGGGRVRRRSVTSMIGSSPCIPLQAERRKNILADPPETVFSRITKAHVEDHESPETLRVIENKPSIASSTTSSHFGDERMIRAKHGLLERQSLENTALVADGEDFSGSSFRMPVFTRPNLANRSRSSTCTSSSGVSGADTPPLSISDGYSSLSEGSLSSIDLSHLNALLSSASHTSSNASFERARPYGRGHGHRRRISQARASRTSIIETIEEEYTSSLPSANSPARPMAGNTPKFGDASATKTLDPPRIFVVDPETSSVDSFSLWDDERGITALRRYYALRDEAEDAVTESQQTWSDTPLSLFALQSFDPPRHRSGMCAMLEHSMQNFGPLPSELRPRRVRSRVNSRPSPYPRTVKTSFTSSPSLEHLRAVVATSFATSMDNAGPRQTSPLSSALQQISIHPNLPLTAPAEIKDCIVSPEKPERVFGLGPRPHLGSTTRRGGWPKPRTGRNGAENKENNTATIRAPTVVNVSQGSIITPADGLRLNRPRPRGRPTLAPVKPLRA